MVTGNTESSYSSFQRLRSCISVLPDVSDLGKG
jgi:hypothetical protein